MNFSHINPYDAYRQRLQKIADAIGSYDKRKYTVYQMVGSIDWWLKVHIDDRHSTDQLLGIGTEAVQRLAEMVEARVVQQETLAKLHEYVVRPPYPDTFVRFIDPDRTSNNEK